MNKCAGEVYFMVLVLVSLFLFSGDPDIVDAIVFNLMKG